MASIMNHLRADSRSRQPAAAVMNTPLQVEAPESTASAWLLGIAMAICSAVVVWHSTWVSATLQQWVGTPVESAVTAVELGAATTIMPVSWPAEPPTPTPTRSTAATELSTAATPKGSTQPLDAANGMAESAAIAADQAEPAPFDLSSVSPELLAAFEDAVAATATDEGPKFDQSAMPLLSELPRSFTRQVPPFSYNAHNFVSARNQRWVMLNDRRLHEGEQLEGLTVVQIEPGHVLLALGQQGFRQPALADWNGAE